VRALEQASLFVARSAQVATGHGHDPSRKGAGREAERVLWMDFYRGLAPLMREDPVLSHQLGRTMAHVCTFMIERASPRDALAVCEVTLALAETLVGDDPSRLEHRHRLAAICEAFGDFLHENGQEERGLALRDRAVREFRSACDLLERRLADDPDEPDTRGQLVELEEKIGRLHASRGRWADARVAFARCRQIAREGARRTRHREVFRVLEADAAIRLAIASRIDRPAEALTLLRETVPVLEHLTRGPSEEADAAGPRALARALFWLASLEDRHEDRWDDAIRDFRRAVAIYERLLRDDPDDRADQRALGASYHNIGHLLVDTGRPAAALEPYRKAIELRESLLGRSPASLRSQSDCGGSWHRLGEAFDHLGRYDDALGAYRKAIAYRRGLVSRAPVDPGYRKDLDERLRDLGRLASRTGVSVR
jgi:tetratricopeptide (TPR) repeat protein